MFGWFQTNEMTQEITDALVEATTGVPTWKHSIDEAFGSESCVLDIDLPGIDIAKTAITVDGDRKKVVVEFTYKKQAANTSGAITRHGRPWGSRKLMFELPGTVDIDKCESIYVDGVLRIVLPRSTVSHVNKIPIKSGNPP